MRHCALLDQPQANRAGQSRWYRGNNPFCIDPRDKRVDRHAPRLGSGAQHVPEQGFEANRCLVPGNLDRAFDRRVIGSGHAATLPPGGSEARAKPPIMATLALVAQYMCWPPLMLMVEPVTKPASSEHKNATPRAISSA